MQTKTYFASSIPAALEVARKELGEDAMLVTSRLASPENKAFGKLEVTFAYESTAATAASQQAPRTEMEEIREQLAALRMAMGRAGSSSPGEDGTLAAAGFDAGLSRDIVAAATRRPGSRASALAHEVASRIPAAPFQLLQPGESRTMAFIGPPGRGKTSSLVKIAARYGIGRRVPVRIFSAGAHGVGCQEQMARYAAILGVRFESYESLESLHLSLTGENWNGLTLIDTPGLSPADRTGMNDFGRFFAGHAGIEKHLVLRADARSADMSYVISRFAPLGTGRLLFAGMDEAVNAAAVIETLIQSKIAGTFLGTGQQIPDDLEEIDAARLARLVCGETSLAAVA